MLADSALIFPVNRSTVVLNDPRTGNVWVMDGDVTLVNNWDKLKAAEQENGSNTGEEGKSEKVTSQRED